MPRARPVDEGGRVRPAGQPDDPGSALGHGSGGL